MTLAHTVVQPPIDGFALALPALPQSIAIARSVVRRVTSFGDADAESSFLVALTEIMANAIDEHQRISVSDAIVLTVSLTGTDTVSISDRGTGIAAGARHPAPPVVESESGRGLSLARAFVPGLVIDSSSNGTTVSLPLEGIGVIR